MGGLRWWARAVLARPVRDWSRTWDEPRARRSGGHAARGSSMGEHAQINERAGGPVAHGSVGRSRGSAPTSYLLVGTPLPRSRPGTGAISVAKRTAVFTIWPNASGNGRTERPARPARILRRRGDASQGMSGGTNDVGLGRAAAGAIAGTPRRLETSGTGRRHRRVPPCACRSASPPSSPWRRRSWLRAGQPRRRRRPRLLRCRSHPSPHPRPTRTGCAPPLPRRSRPSTSSRSRRSPRSPATGRTSRSAPRTRCTPVPRCPTSSAARSAMPAERGSSRKPSASGCCPARPTSSPRAGFRAASPAGSSSRSTDSA